MNKSSIAIVAVLALAVGFALSWYQASSQPVKLESGTWFGEQARALPAFELSDHRNQPLTPDALKGKWNLMFFGFTHCPDICPATLQSLQEMMQSIDDPDITDAIRVYFVSVDPGRDTPEILRDYATYFNPEFIGATANMDKLRVLTRSLGIAHEIHDAGGDSEAYNVDHSGAIVLINPRAEYAALFSAPHDATTMARDMVRIVEHN